MVELITDLDIISTKDLQPEDSWRQVPESKLYLISVNNTPVCYEKNREDAIEKCLQLSEFYTECHPDWNYYREYDEHGNCKITRMRKWLVISYEETYRTISYREISQISKIE